MSNPGRSKVIPLSQILEAFSQDSLARALQKHGSDLEAPTIDGMISPLGLLININHLYLRQEEER